MTQSGRVQDGQTLDIEQVVDPDGHVRMVLLGELDQESARFLSTRLDELRASGKSTRIDLSRLGFIDSSGVRAILVSVRGARAEAWELEVDRQLSWQVQRVFDTLGLDAAIWPPDGSAR